jgi:hypothetical protein
MPGRALSSNRLTFHAALLATPQIARLITLAYPWFPDPWCLIKMAGLEAQEEQQQRPRRGR